MAVRYIVKYGNPVLRIKAKPIDTVDGSIRTLVDDMVETMIQAEGIGLAAPQVAESIALCVVNLGLIEEGAAPKTYINPVKLHEEGTATLEEGCLSIPDIREDVTRPEIIRVRYKDINGEEHEETCDGMLARVLQHEIDHLNGVLIVDRISPIKRKLLTKRLRKIVEESRSETKIPAENVKGGI
ncbi:MAG: peptide deformylase [bacterium]